MILAAKTWRVLFATDEDELPRNAVMTAVIGDNVTGGFIACEHAHETGTDDQLLEQHQPYNDEWSRQYFVSPLPRLPDYRGGVNTINIVRCSPSSSTG